MVERCLPAVFPDFFQKPIPYDIERPIHELEDLKKIKLNMGHHN